MSTVRDNSGQCSSSVDACRVPRRPVISGISHSLRRPWARWAGRHWNEAAADPCNEHEAPKESGGDGMLPKTPPHRCSFSSGFTLCWLLQVQLVPQQLVPQPVTVTATVQPVQLPLTHAQAKLKWLLEQVHMVRDRSVLFPIADKQTSANRHRSVAAM